METAAEDRKNIRRRQGADTFFVRQPQPQGFFFDARA
jgi:hypothetical protein